MSQHNEPNLIVGIGASIGGLEAIQTLLPTLPAASNLAYVLAHHPQPQRRHPHAELFALSPMNVCETNHNVKLEGNTVYLVPPGSVFVVYQRRFVRVSATFGQSPLDVLFHSLARDCGSRAVGIILAGTGPHGRAGLRAIRSVGGLTINQQPVTRCLPTLPQREIDSGTAHLTLCVAEIPSALVRFAARHLADRCLFDRPGGPPYGEQAMGAILNAVVPPALVLAHGYSVQYSHGDLSPYLHGARGDLTYTELSTMLHPELAAEARDALDRCREEQQTVVLNCDLSDSRLTTKITVRPLPGMGDEAAIITFEPAASPTPSPPAGEEGDPADDIESQAARVEALETALRRARANLLRTSEKLEASNEELRMSADASMSMNEALQSANQELEASTEELRLLNDQLTTVNLRLREKIGLVEQAHNDLRNFFASTQVATIFLDEHLCVKRTTPEARALLHIVPSDTGRFVGDLACELLQADLEQESRSVLDALPSSVKELQTRDGRWISRRVLPYRTEDQRIEGIVVTFTDVTVLRSANEVLTQKRLRLELAWEAARGGMFEYRLPAGEATDFSQQWAQIFGYQVDELPRSTMDSWIRARLHPEDLPSFQRAYDDFITGVHERFHLEFRMQHRDGRYLWVRGTAKALARDDQHAANHILGVTLDISDLKEAEQSLRESEARFKHLADNIAQLAWMSDGAGRVFWCNRRFIEYLGVDPSVDPEAGTQAIHPDHRERVETHRRHCIAEGCLWEEAFPLRGAQGKYRWYLGQAVPIRDDKQHLVRWCGTATDITEQRVAEQRLVDADRQKDEFMAVLGHELRNPLAAMRSAAELLQEGEADTTAIAAAHAVLKRQSAHMARLVDGLLDVSRIIHGKIHLEFGLVDLSAICRDVLADLQSRIRAGGIRITADLPKRPLWVEADGVRLAQIVENLITNAVKYTPYGGHVQISTARVGAQAELNVADDGVGIEAELLPQVFDAFKQSTQTLDRQSGGLGLGLALAQSLAMLHGGNLEAHSDGPNQGALFTLTLPAMSPKHPAPPEPPPVTDSRRLRLVVIEDSEDAAQMLERLLARRGHEVQIANEGLLGIELTTRSLPDAVLCDLGLPGKLDGFDVARTLRQTPAVHAKLLALSGYGRPSDQAASTEAGFDAHLTKPVTIDEIEHALFQLCND